MACSAVGCTNSKSKGYRMFCFPVESKRRHLWGKALKRADWTPTKNSLLCPEHFTEDCFREAYGRTFLHKSAIPTVFLAKSSSTKRKKFLLESNPTNENDDQSNSAELYSVNENIDIKSEILEFGPTEYLKSSSSYHEQDFQAMGTYFVQRIELLQPDQRTFALKFINEILNEADKRSLHSNSIEINRLPPISQECKNAALFLENSIHHDDDEESCCDIKPDTMKLIPIPEFDEPIPTSTLNAPSTFVSLSGYNPDIIDDTKPDISRLTMPGTSASALSITPESIETYEIVIKSTSSLSLAPPYEDHSYVRKTVDKSKTDQTNVVLPVSNFGSLSEILALAKKSKYENVSFKIFEEKE